MTTIGSVLIAIVISMIPLSAPADEWTPDPADVAYISRTIWGEARGCSEIEQESVAWCILNRVDDSRFPDTIEGVVTAPYQFSGYSESFPEDDFHDMAEDVLIRWHNGEHGIPEELCFFKADGYGHNVFYSECFGGREYRPWEQ